MQLKTKLVAGTGLLGLAVAAIVTVVAAVPFQPDEAPVGYVGQPVPSSTNVASGTAKLYAIDYDAGTWSGNLHAYPLSANGNINGDDVFGPTGAAGKIRAQATPTDTRFIVTSNENLVGGMNFRWANMSAGTGGRRMMIDAPAVGANSSALFDYLRGSAVNEGTGTGKFRPRASGLGDIIHSTPVYWDDGVNKTVFVGANDGMLHAIDAVSGSERFAFVPSTVIPELSKLATQPYTHVYTVDGRLDVRKYGTTTILAGTLGAGGKGVFALNVTNAVATTEGDAAAKVMWEINNKSTGYASLGDTYGAPVLTKLPGDVAALVLGNGYNNTGTGHAILYVINPNTGALIAAMDTGAGTPAAPNGLSSPSLWDSTGDGVADTAYAGDIDGNMWRFDLSATGNAPVKLFSNTGAVAARAITSAPGVMNHPLGGTMVEFVTGRMFTQADATDTTVHSVYAIWDGAPPQNDTLLRQTLTEKVHASGIKVRTVTNLLPNWTPGAGHHKGWVIDLPIGGERLVGDGAFISGRVYQFFSSNPTVNPTAKPPGQNWWMQLNALSGGASPVVLFDLDNDGQFTEGDKVNSEIPVGRDMGGGVRSQLVGLSAGSIDVFQSNFDRNGAPPADKVTVTSTTVDGERGVSGGHFDTDVFCYNNCGGATAVPAWQGGPNGASIGRAAATGDGAYLRYVHVHEYDDIYDVVGLNMLHPSQDLQRLRLVNGTVGTNVYAPDTPTLQANKSAPSTGVTVVSTSSTTGTSASKTADSVSYANTTATAVAGYPATVTNPGGDIVTTYRSKYTTTMTSYTYVFGTKSGGVYPYTVTTTVKKWDTTITRDDVLPNVSFKVLVSNQANSPAVNFEIAGGTGAAYAANVTGYMTGAKPSAAALPTFTMNNISKLQFSMPLDAFNNKDWGTGVVRTGLHPVMPQCAGISKDQQTMGPAGEWRNGVLTLQVVAANVTDAEIVANSSLSKMGYRLAAAAMPDKLIAEYLIYWHHPSDKCMGSTGWTKAPAQDTSPSDAVERAPAAGADDPHGVFVPGTGVVPPPVPPAPADVVKTNADGSVTTTVVTHTPLANGGYVVTTTVTIKAPPAAPGSAAVGIVTGGAVNTGNVAGGSASNGNPGKDCADAVKGEVECGAKKDPPLMGRVNWREMQR